MDFTDSTGMQYNVNLDIRPYDEDNPDEGMIITLHDVTKESKSQERLKHLATHDNLTTLNNRDGLLEKNEKDWIWLIINTVLLT